jgi:hypothetical protein
MKGVAGQSSELRSVSGSSDHSMSFLKRVVFAHHHLPPVSPMPSSSRRYTEEELTDAVTKIKDGIYKSARHAAQDTGIPRSTLQLRLRGGVSRASGHSRQGLLSPEQVSNAFIHCKLGCMR